MKKTLQTLAAFLFVGMSAGYAQLAAPATSEASISLPSSGVNPARYEFSASRTACPNDTVFYTWQKNVRPGTVQGFTLQDSAGYPKTLSQWFDAPQPITITGMRFIAVSAANQTQSVTLNVYNAGADSLPIGNPIATGTLSLNSTLAWRNVNFNAPVTVIGPYVLTISNTGTTPLTRVTVYTNYQNNNFPADSLSGRGENLAGGDWVGLGGWNKLKTLYAQYNQIVDVDFIMVPIVNYQVTANFTTPNTCIGSTATLQNTSSPILNSRFYNFQAYRAHFLGLLNETYLWTLPTGTYTGTNATVTSSTAGQVSVTLDAWLQGWRMNCGDLTTKNVEFANQVDATFSYASPSFCQNTSTVSPVFGNNASAGQFSSSLNGLSINQTSGQINIGTSTPGSYTVTNFIASSGSCPSSSHTFNITINALPAVELPTPMITAVCRNTQQIPLSILGGTPSGGHYTVNGTVSTMFDPATALSGQNVIGYHYTDNNGCSNSDTEVVTVNEMDNATFNYAAASYCSNGTNPSATTASGVTGTFSSTTGLAFANASNGTIDLAGSTAGTYTVTFNTSGTCPNSSTQQVTINTAPTASLLITAITRCHTDATFPLVGGSPAGGTYYINGVAETSFTPSINNLGTHDVVYTVVDANGCSGSASGTITVEICGGIEAANLADVKVFPNPSKGIITVQTKTNATVVVMDALGAIVAESKSTNQSPSVNFDLSHLNNGMYFVRISTESATVTKKVNIIK
jgi:hypothetical protein